MNALRQKCRPKHQVLILKCYPKLPKNPAANADEVKPNGSELSYLVYYASSRRAKLTKVGSFLEKRTAADVYKNRLGAVHVTLAILTAFLNSSSIASVDAFPLLAPYVLKILQEVLGHSNDVGLVEACLPVWDAFCRDQDHATLAADAEYRQLFSDVAKRWTRHADKTTEQPGGTGDGLKLRKAGLDAVTSIAKAQALASDPGRQIPVVLPVVLRNLYSQDANYLAKLDNRHAEEKLLIEQSKVRPSMQTIRTSRTNEEGDPRAAGVSAAEADQYAEEEAGVLALQSFKALFDVDNRGQVRMATLGMLDFIAQNQSNHGWATSLLKMACTCTPVQDRFVVLFTAVETLISSPIVEDSLPQQLTLAHVIEQVLGSDINLIGLSVMDILLGLVQHVLLVLQLGVAPAVISNDQEKPKDAVMDVVQTASPTRIQLLAHLRQCIVNLARHVYYTDQISDMVSALLSRLKPSNSGISSPATTANAIVEPQNAAQESASQSGLHERPNTDGFFSFDTAREVALDAVKRIFIISNKSDSSSGSNHNPVPIAVWEGTQWLLRDPYQQVRVAYVDALCTWLRLETRDNDSRLEDKPTSDKKRQDANGNTMARRAVSNASARPRGTRKSHSLFLRLLHLAIYEDALNLADRPDADSEFLLLHVLLSSMCAKLGVNAARSGLPMILRLQEDIQSIENPKAKVRLGSLVHGYLWTLSNKLGFEHSTVGNEIQHEIKRRQDNGIWVHGIQVPALPLQQISQVAASAPTKLTEVTVESQALKPFDHRQQLVDAISNAYSSIISSPPASPSSPSGRSFSLPSLIVDTASGLLSTSSNSSSLPQYCADELMTPWTKDELIAAMSTSASKSVSLNGSRTGGLASAHPSGANLAALGDHRRLLAAANTFPYQSPRSTAESFPRNGSKNNLARTGTSHSQTRNRRLVSRSPGSQRRPSGSTSGGRNGDATSSVTNGATRVEELKRVLAGQAPPTSTVGNQRTATGESDSESMIDVEDGEFDYEGSTDGYAPPGATSNTNLNAGSSTHNLPSQTRHMEVPPPTLRINSGEVLQTNGMLPSVADERGRQAGLLARPGSKRVASRSSGRGFGGVDSKESKRELRDLLSAIGTEGDGEGGEGGVGNAPF